MLLRIFCVIMTTKHYDIMPIFLGGQLIKYDRLPLAFVFSVRDFGLWTCLAQLTNVYSRAPEEILARKLIKHNLFREFTRWLIQIKTMSCSEFIFLLLIIMGCDWGNRKMSTLYASGGAWIYRLKGTEICFQCNGKLMIRTNTVVIIGFRY